MTDYQSIGQWQTSTNLIIGINGRSDKGRVEEVDVGRLSRIYIENASTIQASHTSSGKIYSILKYLSYKMVKIVSCMLISGYHPRWL